ncbi:MAG: thioredoxin domain-containing protein [Thioalkalispiraceae bacterium]
MSTKTSHTNKLVNSTSPYLLQHAHNPVDWWPWCDEALALAKQENKLILLSIGYSACHWCHVMAHESFEDEATAKVMNEHYINIKVDREERPDLDKIYQTAHQLLNQRPGGWPLTMFLTPDDHVPFFAGTYFPVTAKHGMPPFKEILMRVDEFYRENPEQITEQNLSLVNALNSLAQSAPSNESLSSAPLDQARRQLEQQFDSEHAGFGKAPKFPHPSNLQRLLRHWYATTLIGNEDDRARDMCRLTLHAMAAGGVYDQLAGGFYRYSVDDYWMIPHFEKMLYDNGPLLSLYTQAYQAFTEPVFARIANETAQWVIDEMQSNTGGYYSTLDADSEGEEGKFYVWTPEQVKSLLSEKEYRIFAPVFGLDRKPNFEGHWHLHRYQSIENVAQQQKMDVTSVTELVNSARQKLLNERVNRIRPGRDEKILTSWNGLMIKGMAQAGRHLHKPEFIDSAARAVRFIKDALFQNGRLLATHKDGTSHLMAYLDDYAFMLDALLELLQADWNEDYLDFAIQLADALLEHFEDKDLGGFYFTANDHENLIQRPKPMSDDATPAGNAIAALALNRLGSLISETTYIESAERTIRSAWQTLSQAPYAHAALLDALEEQLYPPEVIIIRGNPEDKDNWLTVLNKGYAPRRMLFFIDNDIEINHPALKEKAAASSATTAYVCSDQVCQPPITSIDKLIRNK